jgi:hypothetical protein
MFGSRIFHQFALKYLIPQLHIEHAADTAKDYKKCKDKPSKNNALSAGYYLIVIWR